MFTKSLITTVILLLAIGGRRNGLGYCHRLVWPGPIRPGHSSGSISAGK